MIALVLLGCAKHPVRPACTQTDHLAEAIGGDTQLAMWARLGWMTDFEVHDCAPDELPEVVELIGDRFDRGSFRMIGRRDERVVWIHLDGIDGELMWDAEPAEPAWCEPTSYRVEATLQDGDEVWWLQWVAQWARFDDGRCEA
ncbi:MAG: hypothetical protein GY913_16745 [Proteobacteria bacterium]|nr:hypothetical protein [Pseudomonadota bacterium]MCP4918553.1 hypothetical protein [Pseudomonadota bacterium]